MNRSILRAIARPIGGLAVAAALLGVPATAASAAEIPTAGASAAVPSENYYCDWESGYGCASYGYSGYPTDRGWDYGYGSGWYRHHGRHHRY